MSSSSAFLTPSEAARRLGISIKALRLYEQRGLIAPKRTAAGWRAYGAHEMERASEIVALRSLRFSIRQVGQVLKADVEELRGALSAHHETLEGRIRELLATAEKVRQMREGIGRGQAPTVGGVVEPRSPVREFAATFDLPWPWAGEQFEVRDIRLLNHITGPLGSGKTRLAKCLADVLPDAAFLGLERLADDGAAVRARLDLNPNLKSRVENAVASIVADGGTASDALVALLARLESDSPSILVVDMLEQGLDGASQEALMGHLRRGRPSAGPLFFLTRSTAILDLNSVGPDESIIFCPANHAPPFHVAPYRDAPGFEALASCLASPVVRARTASVIACRPEVI